MKEPHTILIKRIQLHQPVCLIGSSLRGEVLGRERFNVIQSERGFPDTSPRVILGFPSLSIEQGLPASSLGSPVLDVFSKVGPNHVIAIVDVKPAQQERSGPVSILHVNHAEHRFVDATLLPIS